LEYEKTLRWRDNLEDDGGTSSLFMSRRFLIHAFTTAQPQKHHDFRVQSKSMPHEDENVRSLVALMSLEDLSQEAKQDFMKSVHAHLGKEQLIIEFHESSARSFLTHREEFLTML
jgi:hypothetical protein